MYGVVCACNLQDGKSNSIAPDMIKSITVEFSLVIFIVKGLMLTDPQMGAKRKASSGVTLT